MVPHRPRSEPGPAPEGSGASPFLERLAYPLDAFYTLLNRPLPPLREVEGEDLPAPYRRLLHHRDDMTPTLEAFHGGSVHIQVLGRRTEGSAYFREVVLAMDGTLQPVEFGAIAIHLERFSEQARRMILEEKRPLGHILADLKIPHLSRPRAFLQVASDRVINEALKLTGAHVLYGRKNVLLTPEEQPLAEIVEILPPAAADA